jgi:hypothetical protein
MRDVLHLELKQVRSEAGPAVMHIYRAFEHLADSWKQCPETPFHTNIGNARKM